MELKSRRKVLNMIEPHSSNRTFMELKYGNFGNKVC